jgi:hypothetical protein
MEPENCPDCGAKIFWVTGYYGKRIALDAEPVGVLLARGSEPQRMCHRPHTKTCPEARKEAK